MLPRVNLIKGNGAEYLLFSTHDAITRAIYSRGVWAAPLLTISKLFYDEIDFPVVVDIGANLGAYSIPVAQELQQMNGEVYSFEAQRLIYYQLCGNIILNRLDNVYAFHLAIGERDGEIELPKVDYQLSSNIGGFSIDREIIDNSNHVVLDQCQRSERVTMKKLDSLVFHKSVDLVKIDVEGYELKVLEGGRGMLEENRYPPLLLEAWNEEWFRSQRAELLNYLDKLGYKYFEILDELIAQHPNHHRHIEFLAQPDGGLRMIRTK